MPTPHQPPITHDALLHAISTTVHSRGGERIDRKTFTAATNISIRNIMRHYASWNEALIAAGFDFEPYNQPLDPVRLLTDLGHTARKLRRAPNLRTYAIHGKHGTGTMRKRFGSWINAHRAFRKFAAGKPEWADVIRYFPRLPASARSRGPLPGRPRLPRTAHRHPYGPPLNHPVMRNAPVNENGVIVLFALLAGRLGFQIESIRTAFPDCEAKRRTAIDTWHPVLIEFEYLSRNFREHGHNPKGCDLIVCWTHNWPECPIEVLVLKDELERLSP